MGFFDTLFGKTETTPLWRPNQFYVSDAITNQVASAIGQGVDPYSGQITPGTSPLQQQAFGAAGGLLSNPLSTPMQSGVERLLSGEPAYQIDPATSRAYYDEAVYRPAMQEFGDTLRGLDARYGARFGKSGAQLEAAHRAAERFGTNLAGIRGDLAYRDEMARRQAAENAMGRIGTGVQAGLGMSGDMRANLGMMAGLGGEQRAIEGQQLAEDYGKWLYAQPYNNPWLGFMGTALTPTPMMQTQQPGILPGLGAAASAAGGIVGGIGNAAGGLLSLFGL